MQSQDGFLLAANSFADSLEIRDRPSTQAHKGQVNVTIAKGPVCEDASTVNAIPLNGDLQNGHFLFSIICAELMCLSSGVIYFNNSTSVHT